MHATAVKELRYQTLARNLLLKDETLGLLQRLSGIPIILLKGAALLLAESPVSSARYTGDIDLLIHPQDLAKAAGILRARGYQASSQCERASMSAYLNSVSFSREAEIPYIVHLHWHLLNTTLPLFFYRIDMEEVWSQALPLDGKKRDVLVLHPEHELVYTCIHAFSHSFRQKDIEDIGRMITRHQDALFREGVRALAREWGAGLPLYCALTLADADPPVELKDDRLRARADSFIRSVRQKGAGEHNQVFPLYCVMAGSIFSRARFILSSVFPPPEVLRRIYSAYPNRSLLRLYSLRLRWAIRSLIELS